MAVKIPIWVRIISIFYFLFGALLFVIGVLLIKAFQRSINLVVLDLFEVPPLLSAFGFALSLICIVLAVVYFVVGVGLWIGNKSSRVGAIALAVVFLLFLINGNSLNTLLGLVICGAIVGYLLFNKKVKKVFES